MKKISLIKVTLIIFLVFFSSCENDDNQDNLTNNINPAETNIVVLTVTGEQNGLTREFYCHDKDLDGQQHNQCVDGFGSLGSDSSYLLNFKFYTGEPDNKIDITQEIINNHQNYVIHFSLVSGNERYTFEYMPETTGSIVGFNVRVKDAGFDDNFGPVITAGLLFSPTLDKSNMPMASLVDSTENLQFLSDIINDDSRVIARINARLPNYNE